MYNVSQEFINKMSSNTRRILGKVQIDYTGPFIDQSIVVTSNEDAIISYKGQVADAITGTYGKIASLDGSWVLDGTWVTAPLESTRGQMGWWGSQLSGTGGAFTTPYPSVEIEFFPRPINNLLVIGDTARVEYPVDFTINLYTDTDKLELAYSEVVTANDSVIWTKALDEAETGIEIMELIITKWSHEGRQAKVIELYTSIQETYEGDEIFSIGLLEEREVSQGTLPVGNISSNEIDLKLYNRDRRFDAGNVDSNLYQLLKANRRIKAWLGAALDSEVVEWVPLGTFWSGDWNIPEQDIYAGVSGRDRLEQLRRSTYTSSIVEVNKSLYYLADSILQDAGLSIDEYEIDASLDLIIIPYSYFTRQSHREALRKIAESCLGQVYCDRDGKIRLTIPELSTEGFNYPELSVNDDLYLLQDTEVEGFTFSLSEGDIYLNIEQSNTKDNYYTKDNPIKWSQIANHIEVNTLPLSVGQPEVVYTTSEPEPIGANETRTLTIFYSKQPCINASATITGPATIDSITYYSWGASVTVSSTVETTFGFSVTADPLIVIGQQTIIRENAQSITDNGLIQFKFPDNPLVQTRSQAIDIAERLVNYYSNPRRDVALNWRGNPAWELGDNIAVIDDNEINAYGIVRQSLDWDGTLKATLEGRRV